MPERDNHFMADSFRYLQQMIRRSGPAASAVYTIMGAVLLFGGVGYVLDRWWHTTPWLLLVGVLLGLVVGFYELAKVIWKKPGP
jgi:F0F1-type ATP synthase assembly protein I